MSKLDLVSALADAHPTLSMTDSDKIDTALRSLIGLLLKSIKLEQAKNLAPSVRERAAEALREHLDKNTLEEISKAWDGFRRISKNESATSLGSDLSDLLLGLREPFDPTPLPRDVVRAMTDDHRHRLIDQLTRFTSDKDLEKWVKEWEPHHGLAKGTHREIFLSRAADLAFGRRVPLDPRRPVNLNEVQSLPREHRAKLLAQLDQIAKDADIKRWVAAWQGRHQISPQAPRPVWLARCRELADVA